MRWLHDDRARILQALAAGDRPAARRLLDRMLRVLRENISGERVSGESSFSDLHDEAYIDAAADLGDLCTAWDELNDDEITAWLQRVSMGPM